LTWCIEARYADASGIFAYNLTNMDVINRDGASGTMTGNVTDAEASWFVEAGAGNLHLTSSATSAIDQGAPLDDVPEDIDGDSRDPSPDVGADELDE
jgi:hypothetical protein